MFGSMKEPKILEGSSFLQAVSASASSHPLVSLAQYILKPVGAKMVRKGDKVKWKGALDLGVAEVTQTQVTSISFMELF